MYRILEILSVEEVQRCRQVAAAASFIEGKVTNPHNLARSNEQLHGQAAFEQSARLIGEALARNVEFVEFAFPVQVAPPLLTRHRPGMGYGAHADAAFLDGPGGRLRSDISSTIFLSAPDSYEGGALQIGLGDADLRFKLQPGQAIFYPSDALNEVEPVTAGERLAAITFVQSRIADTFARNLLFELNEVAALEGNNMRWENFTRLQLIQSSLLRHWGDRP